MEQTQRELYLVKSQSKSNYISSTETHFWLQILEGPDTGMRVSIPATPALYHDTGIKKTISKLDDGQIVEAVLERKDPKDTWKPTEIDIIE